MISGSESSHCKGVQPPSLKADVQKWSSKDINQNSALCFAILLPNVFLLTPVELRSNKSWNREVKTQF